jgi:type III secretion protein U
VSGEKTEEPTPRKLRQARSRGQVPRSRLFTGALVLAGGSAGVAVGEAQGTELLQRWTVLVLSNPEVPAGRALHQAFWLGIRLAAPACVGALAAALAATLATAGWNPRPEALVPRLERLDPWAGLRRIVSLRMLGELGRSLVVATLLIGLFVLGFRALLPDLLRIPLVEALGDGWRVLRQGTVQLWVRGLLLLLLMGAFDLWRARRRHHRDLRMSRDEVRREHREQEGDPRHRAHRRAAHRQLLLAGRARGVEAASVVVVNPTHIAVALRWAPEEWDAPFLVAKGREDDAAELKRRALALGIPVVRDVALARSLVSHDVGEEVPEELYRAAAVVLQIALEQSVAGGGASA